MAQFVIDQNKREALDEDRARDLLSDLKEGVIYVKLSGKSFGDGSAQVASDALERASPTLTHLDLSDIIASRPEDEAKRTLATIADGLKSCKHLVVLDLSDNALGAKGIRAVGDILSGQSQLQQLSLCNNGLAADAGNLITKALIETVPTCLTKLHFHNNLLETAGAIALAPVIENSPKLNDFRFSSLRLGRDGAVHICKTLKPRLSSTLRQLNLSDNSFAEEAGTALANALRDAPFLEELVINDALLGDDGVQLICDILVEGAPKLEVLDISANEMALEGAKGLARLIAVGRLVDVRAEDNELGNVGAKRVAKGAAKSATLRKLDVSACEINSSGALVLAKAVSQLSTFEMLLIDRNCISEQVVSDMQATLEDRLGSLEENDEDDDEEEDDDEDEGEEDEDDEVDEVDTDKAVKSGDTVDNSDINAEEEKLDDLVAQVEKLGI